MLDELLPLSIVSCWSEQYGMVAVWYIGRQSKSGKHTSNRLQYLDWVFGSIVLKQQHDLILQQSFSSFFQGQAF